MGLPVLANTPANLLISATTSGSTTRTIGSGETLLIAFAVSSGGGSPSISGAGATWTTIQSASDGTRTTGVFRGTTPSTGSQTITLSFSNTTTCRWTMLAVTGVSTSTPDAASDSLSTASSARTSTDSSSAGITTAANIVAVLSQAHSGVPSGTFAAPSGWTRVTAGSGTALMLAYVISASAFSNQKGTCTYTSTTTAAQASIAAFNGDDQGGAGGPFPFFTRRKMIGGLILPRGGM